MAGRGAMIVRCTLLAGVLTTMGTFLSRRMFLHGSHSFLRTNGRAFSAGHLGKAQHKEG